MYWYMLHILSNLYKNRSYNVFSKINLTLFNKKVLIYLSFIFSQFGIFIVNSCITNSLLFFLHKIKLIVNNKRIAKKKITMVKSKN